jgi:tetratricopeptide (TPR) repeat protein
MGEVFLAHDPDLDREVAIKFLSAGHSADADSRERFYREARAAAALNHPNIVIVHEVDAEHDRPFIVMEFLQGPDLRRVIRDGPLPVVDVLRVGVALADALGFAHVRGVVHRDVKPENVILVPDGRVKVLDFGLARLPGSSSLTGVGALIGTVAYLAPEIIRGEPASPASDVYALGAVLFEALTGRQVYESENPAGLLYHHLNSTPPRVSQFAPESIPSALDTLILRCLAKVPRDRPTLDEVLKTFADVAAARTSGVRPPDRRWWRAAGAAVVAVAIGLVAAFVFPGLVRTSGETAGGLLEELELARARVAESPDDPAAQEAVVALLEAAGDEEGAVAALMRAAELRAAAGETVQARRLLEHLIAIRPSSRSARERLATLDRGPIPEPPAPDPALATQRLAEGEASLGVGNRALAVASFRVSALYAGPAQYEPALALAALVRDEDPLLASWALIRAGEQLRAAEQPQLAAWAFNEARRLDPRAERPRQALIELGYLSAETGPLARALEAQRRGDIASYRAAVNELR